MDSFEFNKIAGAVLATALGVMAVSIIADMIYTPKEAEKPGYEVAVAAPAPSGAAAAAGAGAAAGPEVAPIAVRLQTADPKAGEAKAKVCLVCHTLGKGEAAKIGPNLYGVVGSPVIHHNGFSYSQAMQDKGATGMTWTFENLDKFLTSPKDFIPGTAMGFAGLKSPTDRANVIDYLRTNADSPLPLPPPPAAPEAAPTTAAPGAGAGATAAPPPPTQPAAPSPSSFDAMLAGADVAAGEAKAKVCLTCHTLNKGGAARVGPNLYGVVGGPAAHMEGYAYSQAMQQKRADGLTWTFDNLNQFLAAPRDFVPDTKMTFLGLKSEQDRANVIAYLRTNADNPLPLPPPPAAPEAAPTTAAPAASAAPTAPAAPAAPSPISFDAMLAGADVAAGEAKAKVCLTCHTLNEGGAARVGPNLYGVVGGPVTHMEGYAYSQAMQQKHADGLTWTFDNLNQFLAAPRDFIPGTKMTFLGLKSEQDRANVIAYLNSNSASPLPLPKPVHSTPLPPPAPQ